MRNKFLIACFLGIFLISMVSASTMTFFVQPFDASNSTQPNAFYSTFFVNLTSSSSCSSAVDNFVLNNVTLNSLGITNLTIDTTGLTNLTQATNVCIYGNGTLITSFPTSDALSRSGYFNQTLNTSSNVFASGNVTGNYGFFSYLGSFLNKITSIFAVNGNFTTLNGSTIYESGSQVWTHNTLVNVSQLNNDVPYALNSSLGNYLLTSTYNTNYTSLYLKSNPYGFYNSSDFVISDYYLKSNPYGFFNLTTEGNIKGSLINNDFNWLNESQIALFNYFNSTGNYLYSSGHSVYVNTTAFNNDYWSKASLVNVSQLNNDVPYALNSSLLNYLKNDTSARLSSLNVTGTATVGSGSGNGIVLNGNSTISSNQASTKMWIDPSGNLNIQLG